MLIVHCVSLRSHSREWTGHTRESRGTTQPLLSFRGAVPVGGGAARTGPWSRSVRAGSSAAAFRLADGGWSAPRLRRAEGLARRPQGRAEQHEVLEQEPLGVRRQPGGGDQEAQRDQELPGGAEAAQGRQQETPAPDSQQTAEGDTHSAERAGGSC